jgi:hypothetical protein
VAEKMENFTALGIDGAKLVNSFTSAISYAPESVAEKMENFKALGIDGAKLVNSFASAISYAPESIKLKKLLCQKLGVWETVLKNLNSGKYIDWLILPIESSIIAVAERTEAGGTPTSLKSIRRTSDIHALATMVEDMNKALYKALPDVEGVHLRYYDNSFWLICWEEAILINTMEDSLEDELGTYSLGYVREMLAERFAKAYAEKLVNILKENCNEPF